VKFLLDANMPRAAAEVMRMRGHSAERVRDIGLGDASDVRIAQHALSIGAVLVTRDLDFADVRRYPPSQHGGLIVLRMPDESTAIQIADVVGRFLALTDLVLKLPGHLVILEPGRARFRPALLTE
jgi:predicted nuclease of predicted toxin-antitoxin system